MSDTARSGSTSSTSRPGAQRLQPPNRRIRIGRGLFWAAAALAVVFASAYAGWRLLAAGDFGYGAAYALLDINATIERYGPENAQRPGFHTTGYPQRAYIFGEIAQAVRAEGEGLESIRYRLPSGREFPVLTAPEVQHLRDVAGLVGTFERVGTIAFALTIGLFALAGYRRWRMPSTRRFALALTAAATGGALSVFVIGPVRTFYWLHERLFPPDHEWFFWYEESLMSMLMQAPNLFGFIAVAWLTLTLAIACGAWAGVARVLGRRAA
ncbi:MAG: DUF1461 domain-containing protein [Halofilum sp. (in: g-proteobacteria)]